MPEPGESQSLIAAAADAGRRLDLFLAERIPSLSRTRIQELIRHGNVQVDGRQPQAAHRISAGESIQIEVLSRPAPVAAAEDLPIELLHVDDEFVVVNKPAGMVVHAGAGHTRGTLVNALLYRLGNLSHGGNALRPGIVHRLDRDTSGAMVVARTDSAHQQLAEQFSSRRVRKVYLALVHGKTRGESGTITLPIARDPQRRTRMTARLRAGRNARTDWRVIARLDRYTLVEAIPHTGRTHQIRAHLSATGHPIVGDFLYGAPRSVRAEARKLPSAPRVFLHACLLGFSHPSTGAWIEVRAPLSADLRVYFEQLTASLGWRDSETRVVLASYV